MIDPHQSAGARQNRGSEGARHNLTRAASEPEAAKRRRHADPPISGPASACRAR